MKVHCGVKKVRSKSNNRNPPFPRRFLATVLVLVGGARGDSLVTTLLFVLFTSGSKLLRSASFSIIYLLQGRNYSAQP